MNPDRYILVAVSGEHREPLIRGTRAHCRAIADRLEEGRPSTGCYHLEIVADMPSEWRALSLGEGDHEL